MTDNEAQLTIAYNVRKFRGKRSLSEIGRLAHTSAGAVNDIEQNGRMPGAGLISRLADALGVGIEDLLKKMRKSKQSA